MGSQRQRNAIIGLGAILAACLGSLAFVAPVHADRVSSLLAQVSPATAPSSQPASLKDDPRYRRWRVTITWSLVILIAFVTAAAAIIVFSRGFRRWMGREQHKPTASEDVWAMHRTPDEPPELDGDDADSPHGE